MPYSLILSLFIRVKFLKITSFKLKNRNKLMKVSIITNNRMSIWAILLFTLLASTITSQVTPIPNFQKCETLDNCETCSKEPNTCEKCSDGYYFHESANRCDPCAVKHCNVCKSKETCSKCRPGTYFNKDKVACSSCVLSNCKECSSSTKCLACNSGWVVNSQN